MQMKRFKAILALLLVAALLCMLFAACASEGESTGTPDSGSDKTENTTGGCGSGDKTDDSASADPEEIVNIVLAYLDVSGNETSEWDRMAAYVNEISEPEIGVHVEFVIGQMGDYGTTIPMMIAGNEQLDLVNICPVGGMRFGTLMSNNSLMDVRKELETYAPDAMEICGEASIKNYRKGDALYGLPTNRINTSNEYAILRKDILEATGQLEAAENCSSWTELEAIFAAVYDYCTENNIYVIGGQKAIVPTNATWTGDAFSTGEQFDAIGDTTALIYTDQETGEVSCVYENEDRVALMKRGVTWKENGWIYPDTILGDDHVDNLMKQGVIFCNWNHTEIGVETARKLSSGYDVVCPMTCPGIVQSSNLGFGIGIPVTCEDVEAACKFINLMYTDARVSTVFAWGIEGEDYVMVNGEATYPEPKSNFHAQDYMIGNQMLVPAWEGQGADFRARAAEANANAKASRFVGMNIDTSDLGTQIAALAAVKDEFAPSLLSGDYTDALYEDFLAKLNSVGLQDYVDAVQKQLDAWLAENE